MNTPISTRALGLKYRHRCLHLLARVGYATTRQLARGVWGEVTESTRKMAARTVRSLLDDRLLVERRDDVNDERMVALTNAGVYELRKQVNFGLACNRPHARDWLRHAHAHRTAANSVFVAAAEFGPDALLKGQLDWLGYTELEVRAEGPEAIRAAWCRYESGIEKDSRIETKVADGVLFRPEGSVWLEVENCYRGTNDMAKCIDWLRGMFSFTEPNVAAVWFVITAPGAVHIGQRLREGLKPRSYSEDARPRQARELDARILAERIRVFELDHERLTLRPVPH